ncbi:MAG: hypothetical protein HY460_01800 [Parcubacteria group bacterium]|nr:hypothetical protein [Parcubacteria group bacterium]
MPWFDHLSSFFHRTAANETHSLLAIDIGTHSAKCAIFDAEMQDDAPRITVRGYGSVELKSGAMRGGVVTDTAAVIHACEEALLQAERTVGKRVREALIAIGGGMARGVSLPYAYERKSAGIAISLAEVRTAIGSFERTARERVGEIVSTEWGVAKEEARILTATAEEVRIDGYRVSDPIGLTGKTVQLKIFHVYTRNRDAEILEEIADKLHVSLHAVTAGTHALAQAYAAEEGERFGAIFIDVGGEITDIAVMRAGEFEGICSFPFGGEAYTKRIADELAIPFDDAEDLKIKFSAGGHLASSISQKVAAALERDIARWLESVELSLREFSQVELFPPLCILSGSGAQLRGIGRAVGMHEWTAHLPFPEQPEVRLSDYHDFSNLSDRSGAFRGPGNSILAGLAIRACMHSTKNAEIETAIAKSLQQLRQMV